MSPWTPGTRSPRPRGLDTSNSKLLQPAGSAATCAMRRKAQRLPPAPGVPALPKPGEVGVCSPQTRPGCPLAFIHEDPDHIPNRGASGLAVTQAPSHRAGGPGALTLGSPSKMTWPMSRCRTRPRRDGEPGEQVAEAGAPAGGHLQHGQPEQRTVVSPSPSSLSESPLDVVAPLWWRRWRTRPRPAGRRGHSCWRGLDEHRGVAAPVAVVVRSRSCRSRRRCWRPARRNMCRAPAGGRPAVAGAFRGPAVDAGARAVL